MNDQHTHIKVYRHLSPEEVNLMKLIKEKGAELLALHATLAGRLSTDH